MGISIYGNYKNSICIDGSSSSLTKIRNQVALAWDKEFGKHYITLDNCDDYEEFDKKANEILAADRFDSSEKDGVKGNDQDIIDFLFASDYNGKVSYKTCKKIYELIKDVEYRGNLRYMVESHNDWEDFKKLLRDCYSHRCYMKWD